MSRPYAELKGIKRVLADFWAFLVLDHYRDSIKHARFADWHLAMLRRYVEKSLPLCGLERIERELECYLEDNAAPAIELARKVAAEIQAPQEAAESLANAS